MRTSSPSRLAVTGRIVFGIAVAALGSQDLIGGELLRGLQPVPAWLPAHAVWAELTGAVLVVAGAGIVADKRLRVAARGLLALLCLWLAVVHLPIVIAEPRNGGAWTAAFETVALAGAAATLALPSRPALGRVWFGVSLPVFGVLHLVYLDYVTSVIPAWIPGHLFWAVATGAAQVAAGAALVFDVKARLAATLAGAMFGSWVVILHAPRVAERHHRAEWTSLFVALAMCGGAWLFAGPRHGALAGPAGPPGAKEPRGS